MKTSKEREQIMDRARAKRGRKASRRPASEPDVASRVKKAAAAAVQKVGAVVRSAATGVKQALTGAG